MDPKKLPGLWKSYYVVLEGAMKIVKKRLRARYAQTGVKPRHVWILMAARCTACSQTTVGKALQINPNVIKDIVDEMEEMGLIMRVSNMENRREYILQPAGRGLDILKWVDANFADAAEDDFRPVSLEKLELMRTLALSIIQEDVAENSVKLVHKKRKLK